MRKRLVAGNWKMNTDLNDGYRLLKEILDAVREPQLKDCDVHIYAPFTHLKIFHNSLNGSGIALGAQNCHHKDAGAYTGEVSAKMLSSVPVSSVLVGHSERRAYCGETNAILAEKISTALENGLNVIYCFGETLSEREQGEHFNVVKRQIEEGTGHLSESQWSNITLAYEPVWAIGTGKTATADQAQEIHAHSREILAAISSNQIADKTRILYGGSVKPKNAAELFSMNDIDGGLIGGAALNAESFAGIINA